MFSGEKIIKIKVGWEIQVAEISSGNYHPRKYSKFDQSGKYWEIQNLELFLARLSYCDWSLSVAHALSTFCFK